MNSPSVAPARSLRLIDTTLRDGEQAPGVVFTDAYKLRIAELLDALGVDEIEAGTPAIGRHVIDSVRSIVRKNFHARILVWSRALKEDIEQCASTGAEAVHIAFPLSDVQLNTMGKDFRWALTSLPELVACAKESFRYVSVGAQDAGRCNGERLLNFVQTAVESGVQRLRIADTVGVMTPLDTCRMIRNITAKFPSLELDFHAHNDLGMATANAVTALFSGASSVSLTVCGLGERAGNAALEQVVMALAVKGVAKKYNTDVLHKLCSLVAEASGRPVPVDKPVCGDMAFSHESGIHAKATLMNTLAYQAFDGLNAGRESFRMLFGTHSGSGAIRNTLEYHGLCTSDDMIAALKTRIAAAASKLGRALSEEEILFLCK